MNKKLIDYQEELIKDLQDPSEAQAYFNAAAEDDDKQIFLLALKNILEAQMGKQHPVLSKKSNSK